MSLPTSSASKMSVDSSQSLQSQDESPEVPRTFCLSCNTSFSDSAHHNRHLPCRFEVNEERLAGNPKPLKLSPPLDRDKIPKILQHLAESDFVDLCISQNWCCQDMWPLVFAGPVRSGIGLFGQYTANKWSTDILKRYLSVRNNITIPRCILIEDPKNGIKSLLTGQMLLPPNNKFDLTSTADSYIVTKYLPRGECRDGGGDGGRDGGDDGEEDGGDDGGDGGDDGDDDDSSSGLDSDDDEESPDVSEDSDDSDDAVTMSRRPQPQPFATLGTFQDIQHLLPYAGPGRFYPGVDGEGEIDRFS